MDRIRYTSCGGTPTGDQRSYARKSPLYQQGDMVLVWVNEGDLCIYGTCMDDVVATTITEQPHHVDIPIEGFPDLAPPAQPYSGGPFEQNDKPRSFKAHWAMGLLIILAIMGMILLRAIL